MVYAGTAQGFIWRRPDALCRRTMGMGWQRLGLRWSVGVEKGGLFCENLARRISRRGLKRVLQGILRRRSRVAHPRCRKIPSRRRGCGEAGGDAPPVAGRTPTYGGQARSNAARGGYARGAPRVYTNAYPLWGFGSMLRKGRVKRVYDMGHGSYRSAIDLGDPLG